MTYYILSIDGGGIRGLLVSVLLQRLLAESIQPNFLNQIDLYAGTSTGGIIALGLASGLSPKDARRLYEQHGAAIFTDSLWDNLKDLGSAIGAQYNNDGLKQALTATFANKTLDDLDKRVLITSFDLDNEGNSPDGIRRWKPKFFHNYPGEDSDGTESVVDVAIRTAAAPILFPIYQGYVDGGVVANNPSMCALAQAVDTPTGGQQLENVVMLSIGTGRTPLHLSVQNGDWGWQEWAVRLIPSVNKGTQLPLLELVMEGMNEIADYQCRHMLGERYHRLQINLPEPIGLDAIDKMDTLIEIAESAQLQETIDWLAQHF